MAEIFLRCPSCNGTLDASSESGLTCVSCNLTFPIENGIPRMLRPAIRAALQNDAASTLDAKQAKTALSFGYEWQRFPEMYAEWEKQFLDYMQPHTTDFFKGKKVLDAGCGNGRFAYYAGKYAREVWAIDLGPAVEVARKNTASLDNVHVVQADLHNPPFPLESFDFIYSIGVLHHLPDPDAGLCALRDLLAPDGAMNVMLYAPYGRTGIYIIQEFCRRVGITATDVDIRDLVAALKALPPGHPMQNLLRDAPDFRNEAALADALLHPCDRAYSVPQLFDFLHQGGLRFDRWVRQAAYSPRCGVMATLPQAARIEKLPIEEQYAAAELFRGTMLRHSVIARRHGDAPHDPIAFSGDGWLAAVPVRMPDTVCVRERLPPGAAAVLISQSHTYRDIYLPIDAMEMRMLESIDGHRSVGDIIGQATGPSREPSRLDQARSFFERLWWHDQVVFDTSGA